LADNEDHGRATRRHAAQSTAEQQGSRCQRPRTVVQFSKGTGHVKHRGANALESVRQRVHRLADLVNVLLLSEPCLKPLGYHLYVRRCFASQHASHVFPGKF
jgi:hypothetical protein